MPVGKIAVITSILCAFFLAVGSGQDAPSKYYNVKAGPVLVTLSSGASVQYQDNVNLSNGVVSPIQSDIIASSFFGVNAVTQAELGSRTQSETLSFSMNVGYKRYLMHPELNINPLSITLSPDSELAFLVRAGHFKIRFSDGFSLQQDPSSDGTLSNIAEFRRFVNTVGVNTQWDMNSKTSLSLGYSHSNLFALSVVSLSGTALPNASSLDSSNDSVSFSAVCKVFSLLSCGVGASASASNFPDNPAQNTTTYSVGPFMDAIITQYTTLHASCSVAESRSGGMFDMSGNGNGSASNTTTNNFDLSLVNRMNRYYTHSLGVGRNIQLDILGQQTIADSVRYSSTWRMNSAFTLTSSIFAEDVTSLGGFYSVSPYRRYGCSFGTGYQLSRRLSSAIVYQYTNKISDNSTQSYKLNSVTLSFNYAF